MSICRIHNVSIRACLRPCPTLAAEHRRGMGWYQKASDWGPNLKGNTWYKKSTLPNSTKAS